MSCKNKLLALILAMAFLAIAAEAARHAMASPAIVSTATAVAGQDDDDADVVALPWRRRVLRHRGRKEHGGGDDFDWRTWRMPPSGPSGRGHVAVDVESPEEEKKTAAEEAAGGGRSSSSSAP
uniref:Uncharacterized protein n=1 Tax=Leersia perrieri TaxID=77586 RepID=A0A0D9VE67_9ORYZ